MFGLVKKIVILSSVFCMGVAIGAITAPDAGAFEKMASEPNVKDQDTQKKAKHLRLKISKKKRYA